MFRLSEATGLHLFESLKRHCERYGPSIMNNESRALLSWPERERPIVLETDLEENFQICKEMIIACMEKTLEYDLDDEVKGVPNLAEFEAGFCLFEISIFKYDLDHL